MMTFPKNQPKTLLQAITYFADPAVALQFMAAIRWPDGVKCPRCAWDKVSFLKTRGLWKCLGCKKQFSVKVGTVMEDSPIPLSKWMPALWLLSSCKNGISSYELGRALGVSQKSAWFMLSRLRLALNDDPTYKFTGHCEADETFIGGRGRNMHADKRKRLKLGRRSLAGKVAVMGVLERSTPQKHSTVRLKVLSGLRKSQIQETVRDHVALGANVTSDAFLSYVGLSNHYVHTVIDHAEKYADGIVHTNGMENFWSLLKRAIKGTYISVEPFHLFRYLDEQAFRFNTRKASDFSRFVRACKGVLGKRLTFTALTGSELPQTC
jgi:transposase-like protein